MDQTKKALLSIDIDTNALAKSTAEAKQKVADLTAELKRLKGAGAENSVEAVNLAAQLKNARQEVTQGVNTAAQYDKALKENTGYLSGLKLELSLLQKQFGDLSKEELNNAEIGGKMQERAQALAKEIQKLDQSVGNNKSTIGGYENSIISALDKTGLFGSTLGKATATANQFKDGVSAVKDGFEKATTALTVYIQNAGFFTNTNGVATTALSKVGTEVQAVAGGMDLMTVGTATAGAGLLKMEKEAETAQTGLKTLTTSTGVATKGLDVMKVGTESSAGGFKILKLAMASTGIFLLITGFAALITYFEQTNEGSKKLKVIMAEIGSVTQSIYKILAPIGKALFDILTEPQGAIKLLTSLFQLLIIPIKTFVKVMNDISSGEFKQAFKDLGEGVLDYGSKIKDAAVASVNVFKDTTKAAGEAATAISKVDFKENAKTAGEATRSRQELTKAEREWSGEKLKQQDTLGKINNSLKNVNITESDRIKLINQAKDIREQVYKRDTEIAQKNLEIVQKEQDVLSKKDYQAIQDAKNRVQELKNSYDAEQAAYDTKQSKLEKKQNSAAVIERKLLKESESERIASLSRTAQKIYDAYADEILKTDEKYRKLEEKFKNYAGKSLKIRADYLNTINQLEKEKAAEQKEIQEKFNKDAEANLKALNKRLADARARLAQDETQRKIDELKQQSADELAEIDKQTDALDKQIAQQVKGINDLRAKGKIQEADAVEKALQTEIKELEAAGDLKAAVIAKQIRDEQKIRDDAEFAKKSKGVGQDLELDGLTGNFKKEFDDKKRQLELEHDQAVKAAREKGEDTYKIEDIYKKKVLKLNQDKQHAEDESNKIYLKGTISLANGLMAVAGKNTQAFKIAFKAQQAAQAGLTVIDTYRAVMGIWAANSSIPFVGVPKAIAETAIAVGTGIASLAQIWAQKPGFARGGLIQGPGTGTSDSIEARLSHGESVINARSTSMFAPLLSALNVAGGGRAFDTPAFTPHFAMGGYVSTGVQTDVSNDVNQIVDAMNKSFDELPGRIGDHIAQNMPNQVLVIEDVQAGLNNKTTIQSLSNR